MANYAPLVAKKPNATSAPRSKSFGIFFSIILTALVVGGGSFAYQYFVTMPNQDDAVRQKEQELSTANEQLSLAQKQLADLQREKEETAKKMVTFYNSQYAYNISYPQDTIINDDSTVSDDGYIQQIRLTQADKIIFMLRVNTEEETAAYKDQEPVGQIEMAGIMANKYIFANGVCDGGVCTEPMTVVKGYKNGRAYILEFYNVTDITDKNLEILNSFQFNN